MSSTVFWLVIFLAVFAVVLLKNEQPPKQPTLVFCDVGQGDAVLYLDGEWQLLVDAGPNEAVLQCLARYMAFWDRTIEMVVLTHPDSDHLGGLQAVLERFETPVVMFELLDKKTAEFDAFKRRVLSKVSQKKTKVVTPQQGEVFEFGGRLTVTTLWPDQKNNVSPDKGTQSPETQLWDSSSEKVALEATEKNYNNRSIALLLEVLATRVLLTGDIEAEVEQSLKGNPLIKRVNVIKIAHHGSKTSSTQAFLNRVRPETAVVSAGKNNQYGHPSPEVLTRFFSLGSRVFSTAASGDVVITFFENGYSVKGGELLSQGK